MSLVGELNENKILYAGKLVIALRENRTKYTPRKPLSRILKKKEMHQTFETAPNGGNTTFFYVFFKIQSQCKLSPKSGKYASKLNLYPSKFCEVKGVVK
jgi:hypothetical protein